MEREISHSFKAEELEAIHQRLGQACDDHAAGLLRPEQLGELRDAMGE